MTNPVFMNWKTILFKWHHSPNYRFNVIYIKIPVIFLTKIDKVTQKSSYGTSKDPK